MRDIIFDTENCKIYWDSSNKIIFWEPLNKMSSDEFRNSFIFGFEKALELSNNFNNINWVNLVENVKVANVDDLKWLTTYSGEMAEKIGIKKVAFTKPKDIFGWTGITIYTKLANNKLKNLTIKYFSNEDDAIDWIKIK